MTGTRPKPFVFVLMPFSQDFEDVYNLGIKAACDAAGAYCERVDEQLFTERILDRIYNQIARADLVVADMSTRNPNVFYEAGYAHALGKRTILLVGSADDIPFDLKHFPHIIYGKSITTLKAELEKRVRWAIEHPERSVAEAEPGFELYVDGDRLEPGGVARMVYHGGDQFSARRRLQIDIHNPTNRSIAAKDFQFAVVCAVPASVNSAQVVRQPDGLYAHFFPPIGTLLPQGWGSTAIDFYLVDMGPVVDASDKIAATVRMYSELGVREIPVTLEFP